MTDRVHMTATALYVRPFRATVMPTSIALPIAALCATAGGLAWPVEMEWGDWAEMVVLAGLTLTVAGLLAATVRLLVLDWWAEMRSRAEWAALAAGAATAMLSEDQRQSEHLYQPAVCDEAVQAVLRAHRYAVPRHVVEPAADIGSSHDLDETGLSQPTGLCPGAVAIEPPLPDSSDISAGEFAEALDANTKCADAKVVREGWRVVHSLAPVASVSRSKRRVRCGEHVATHVRHIVNAGSEYTWNSSGPRLRVMGVPIKIVSDIVIVGQGEQEPSDDKPALGTQFNGGTIGSGPSGSIAGSTVLTRSRRRGDDTSTDLAAAAEARRQVIALAEALARQAAREDDAAEQVQKRSRSPPEMGAEESPSGGAKDDTS